MSVAEASVVRHPCNVRTGLVFGRNFPILRRPRPLLHPDVLRGMSTADCRPLPALPGVVHRAMIAVVMAGYRRGRGTVDQPDYALPEMAAMILV
jgi:hypothetical protein